MASSYSTDLKLELMVTGEKAGLWGDITNTNLAILQQAIAGYTTVNVNGTTTGTLTFTNGALSNGKNIVLDITGTPSGAATITMPDGIEKTYIIKNSTGGTETVTVKTSSGTGVSFAASEKTVKIAYADGTNLDNTNIGALANDYSPQLSAALDTNGNDIIIDDAGAIEDDSNQEYIKFSKTASAVNEITVQNQATGSAPSVSATGDDTNIDLNLASKGTGFVKVANPGSIEALKERATVNGTFTSNINMDLLTSAVRLDTAAATANFTVNLRGDGSNSLDSVMDNGDSFSVALITKQNATAYYNTTVQVDGSTVTPVWQGGSAPTEGNTTSNDVYTYTAIKTASSTFTVLASQTQFA